MGNSSSRTFVICTKKSSIYAIALGFISYMRRHLTIAQYQHTHKITIKLCKSYHHSYHIRCTIPPSHTIISTAKHHRSFHHFCSVHHSICTASRVTINHYRRSIVSAIDTIPSHHHFSSKLPPRRHALSSFLL